MISVFGNASNTNGLSECKKEESYDEKSDGSTDSAAHRPSVGSDDNQETEDRNLLKSFENVSLGLVKIVVDSKTDPPRVGNEEGLKSAKDNGDCSGKVDTHDAHFQWMINQEMKKHLDSCAQERQGLKEVIDGHEKVLSQYENVVNELEKELEHCHLQIQELQDAKVVTEEQLEALENDKTQFLTQHVRDTDLKTLALIYRFILDEIEQHSEYSETPEQYSVATVANMM
ncbi:MAG: hypothetical protein MMC33_008012 [Icmadophila ericetorum]|nr:hypothetical protein [Icmadophila ericetorum]